MDDVEHEGSSRMQSLQLLHPNRYQARPQVTDEYQLLVHTQSLPDTGAHEQTQKAPRVVVMYVPGQTPFCPCWPEIQPQTATHACH